MITLGPKYVLYSYINPIWVAVKFAGRAVAPGGMNSVQHTPISPGTGTVNSKKASPKILHPTF